MAGLARAAALPPTEDRAVPFSRTRFLALFILLCFVFALRRPDALLNPQFWAEDGTLLFHDAMLEGALAPILQPYRGYLIVSSRLVAAFAGLFPVLYAPLIYNLTAILIAAGSCSLFALPWYRYLVRSDLLRAATCLALAGALYTESLVDNLANSQWYLALAGMLLLAREAPRGVRTRMWLTALVASIGALAALTNPVMVVALPVCLWLLAKRRNQVVAAAVLGGIGIQLGCYLWQVAGVVRPTALGATGLDRLAAAAIISTVYHVLLSSLAGEKAVVFVSRASAEGVFLVTLIGAVTGFVCLYLRLDRKKRLQIAAALYLAAASIALPLASREGLATAFATPTHIAEHEEQYFFIAGCVLVIVIAIAIEFLASSYRGAVKATLLLVVTAGGFAGNFEAARFFDFEWSRSAKAVQEWSTARAQGKLAAGVTVPINPGWVVKLPGSIQELTISGFPDGITIVSGGTQAARVGIQPIAIGKSPDNTYVELPAVFGTQERYRVRAVVQVSGKASISLLVHGRITGPSRVETAPVTITDSSSVLETEVVTDITERLCIHVRRHAGAAPVIQSITITRI